MGLIGSVLNGAEKFTEADDSPTSGIDRVYDSKDFGWLRETEVRRVLTCYKRDLPEVYRTLSVNPAPLITNAGQDENGNPLTMSWGYGYVLKGATQNNKSPSMASLTVTYALRRPEVVVAPPDGMQIIEADGKVTFKLFGAQIAVFDSGGSTTTTGLTFRKQPAIFRLYRPTDFPETDPRRNAAAYARWMYKCYPLDVLVDGVKVQTHFAMEQFAAWGWTASPVLNAQGQVASITNDTVPPGTKWGDSFPAAGVVNYTGDLRWVKPDYKTFVLMWRDFQVWKMVADQVWP